MKHLTFPEEPDKPVQPIQPPSLYVYEEPVWEYKLVSCPANREQLLDEDDMNTLGKESWELAGVLELAASVYYYFKRVKQS